MWYEKEEKSIQQLIKVIVLQTKQMGLAVKI